MLYTKVVYKNKEMKGERLELTDKNALYFIGPDVKLTDCTIVSKIAARNLLIRGGVQFVNCTFEVKQELKNHQDWITASLKGCRFKGRLSGCDFGFWPEYNRDPEYQLGAIEDCDFSEARLDGCRFMDCDPSTLRLPGWPCFTILDPIARAPELLRVKWPGIVGDVVIEDLARQPARTKAVTLYAPAVAKQLETTPEELRAVIEKFDCIRY